MSQTQVKKPTDDPRTVLKSKTKLEGGKTLFKYKVGDSSKTKADATKPTDDPRTVLKSKTKLEGGKTSFKYKVGDSSETKADATKPSKKPPPPKRRERPARIIVETELEHPSEARKSRGNRHDRRSHREKAAGLEPQNSDNRVAGVPRPKDARAHDSRDPYGHRSRGGRRGDYHLPQFGETSERIQLERPPVPLPPTSR